jgi:hypothetical protein
MTTATERNLDGEVNKALAALRRRRAFKELAVIVVLIAALAGLLGLTAIMYQEPIDTQKPSNSSQSGQLQPGQP